MGGGGIFIGKLIRFDTELPEKAFWLLLIKLRQYPPGMGDNWPHLNVNLIHSR
jgi:hypothetical protein